MRGRRRPCGRRKRKVRKCETGGKKNGQQLGKNKRTPPKKGTMEPASGMGQIGGVGLE